MSDQNNDLTVNLIFKLQNEGKLKDAKVDLKGVEQNAKAASAEAQRMGATVSSSAARVSQSVTENNAALGMTRREWMRTGSEAAFYARTALGSLGQVDKGLTQAIGLATQLGESFMFGGAVGIAMAAASTGIGYIIGEMQKAEEAARKAVAPYQQFAQVLNDLNKLSSPLAQTMREQFNVTKEQAVAMAELVEKNEAYRTVVEARNVADQKMVGIGQQLGEAKKRLTQLEQEQAMAMGTGSAAGDEYNAAMEAQRQIIANLTVELTKLSGARQNDITAMADQASKSVVLYSRKRTLAQEERADINLLLYLQDEQAKKLKEQETAYNALGKAMAGIYRGMIEKAMTPTKVTQEDIEATKAGKYKDKWDEFARRADAVAKGTDPSAYGANFKKMFDDLGMGAEEAATKFRDFSLFADPKNLTILSEGGAMDTIEQDVERQIDAMLGKANAMKEAMKKVWDKLPEEKKEALKKLGIETLDDAQKKALGLAEDIAVGAKQSDEFAANLKKMRSVIEETLGGDVTIRVNYEGGGGGGGDTSDTGKNENYQNMKDAQLEGRASGGSMLRGRSYLVGEWGPEIVTSRENSYVYNNRETREILSPPARSGPLVGQIIVNNQQDVERLLNDIARRVRFNR